VAQVWLGMKIYFGGAEKGSYRNLLLTNNVTRFGINLTHFPIPKKKELNLSEVFGGGEVLLYLSENDEDVARYDTFIREHADSLSIIIGRPDYDGAWLGDKYVPIWNDEQDIERLAWLCQKYGRVAVSDKAVNGRNVSRIKQLSERWGAKLIGITSKPDLIEAINWESVVVVSWTSVMRYGETQVWDGHGLRRYPAQQKDSARKKHRSDIIRLGIDIDDVMEDSVSAVGALAIESWKQWESRTFGGYDPSNVDDEAEFNPPENDAIIAIAPSTPSVGTADFKGTGIAINVPEKRHEGERVLLPVMGVEMVTSMGSQTLDEQGESIEINPTTTPVLKYNANPLRQCNNCYLSSRCPSFKENAECAFSLPIEIRTKDQLNAAMRALIEMQMGRVMFARFAEEMEGQGIDPALSSEMDRLFNLVDKMKNISDNREMVSLKVEASGSSGVLSRLFGQKAGEMNRMLPNGGMDSGATDAMYADIIDLSQEG
jgi:hypothetical protein